MRTFLKGIVFILLAILSVVVFSLFPTLSLGKSSMRVLEGDQVRVYYSGSEAKAQHVKALAQEHIPILQEKLAIHDTRRVDIVLYEKQLTMQSKKYGYLIALFAAEAYGGDVLGDSVLLSAPDVTDALVLHQLVHFYTRKINPELSYWLDNGLAAYLAAQTPEEAQLKASCAPSYKQTRSDSVLVPWQFEQMDGPAFAYSYIQFLKDTYSWEQVITLIQEMDYEKSFAETEKAIYNEWIKELRLKSG